VCWHCGRQLPNRRVRPQHPGHSWRRRRGLSVVARRAGAADAAGRDAATAAPLPGGGDERACAVEPWPADGCKQDTISCQLTRCEQRTWPLVCQSVARTSATGAAVLAGCPYRPGSRRQNGVSAARSATTCDRESKPRGRRGAEAGHGLEQSAYGRGVSAPFNAE